MKKLAATALAFLLPAVANAAWVSVEGGASAKPDETNSTIELIILHCADGPAIAVYSRGPGAVLPDDASSTNADYFYKPGAVAANVDGVVFPLIAGGMDDAIILFSEGPDASNLMLPLDPDLTSALLKGVSLTLAFDITGGAGADGSQRETWARFSLDGAATTLEAAVAQCR
jgi:hypothetical protein